MQQFLLWRRISAICTCNSGEFFVNLRKACYLTPCENCKFRASYDKNPKSAKGRFWRWHINWCPGWKNFFTHQDEETKAALREKYSFTKYQ